MKKRWAILRWACTAGLLASVAASVFSVWFAASALRAGSGPSIALYAGKVRVAYFVASPGGSAMLFGPVDGSTHLGGAWFGRAERSNETWTWAWEWSDTATAGGGMTKQRVVPLWVPVLLFGAASVALWRSHIRERSRGAAQCPNCNYSLTGLPPNSPCPECGPKA